MNTLYKCVTFMKKIQHVLPECADLRKEEYKSNPHPLAGHCYVASEALFHLAKREGVTLRPMHIRHEGVSHWYLKMESGFVLDPTEVQFTTFVDYPAGKGKGFLTTQPSKRAAELIRRTEAV